MNWKFFKTKVFKTLIDWAFIVVGLCFLMLYIINPDNKFPCWIVFLLGAIGLYYIIAPLWMYLFNRIKFDWYLVNSNFLKKVCCLVIYMPFVILMNMHIAYYCSFKWKMPEITARHMVDSDDMFRELSKSPGLVKKAELDVQDPSLFWTVYYHFIDPGNQHMATSSKGRPWAALVSILGVFMVNGLLVTSIIGYIDRRKAMWCNGEIRYSRRQLKKFAIVIGANEIVYSVIRNLLTPIEPGCINNKCEENNDYIVVQTCRDPQKVRDELASRLTDEQCRKILIYKALRDSKKELEELYPHKCTEMYVLGESTLADGGHLIEGGESFHDALNMRCVNIIADIISSKRNEAEENGDIFPSRRICKVLFEYQTTYSIFQFSGVSDNIKKNLVFIPINRYDFWACKVLVDNYSDSTFEKSDVKYIPLDGNGITKEDSPEHIHFVIVGMSKMGIALGVQAMLQAHYINFAGAKTSVERSARRTRITFIDTNADTEMAFFKGRYENLFSLTRHRYIDTSICAASTLEFASTVDWVDPMAAAGCKWSHLSDNGENFIDIELEFIKGSLESDKVRKYLELVSDNSRNMVDTSKLTIAICLTQTHQAVAAALYMPIKVYEKAQEILVYQRESADIIKNLTLQGYTDKRYEKLRAFGMLYSEYLTDRTMYLKSLMVNGVYDKESLEGVNSIDMARKETYKELRLSWRKLPLDKTFSNKYFVDSIGVKLRSLDLDKDSAIIENNASAFENDNLAKVEHNRWNIQQLIFGYSPCDKDMDTECARLNSLYKVKYDDLKTWEKTHNWDVLSKEKRKEIENNDSDYKKLKGEMDIPKGNFKNYKETLKVSNTRNHPNICDYNHLDIVDFGAKPYDAILNKAIPKIIEKVDNHPSLKGNN